MPWSAKSSVEIPNTSLPSFVFQSPSAILSEDPIILDPERPHDRFLTLGTYRKWSQCLASGLQNRGLQKGDRVLFVSGNSIAWPVTYMGTIMAGGILASVSPALPYETLIRLAKDLEPKFILADTRAFDNASNVAAGIGVPKPEVFVFDRESLFVDTIEPEHSWKKLLDSAGASFDWKPFTSPKQLAVINYTSGSAGQPKGVMVSHKNIVANATQYIEQQKSDPRGPENGNSVNWVMWTPIFHAVGQNQFCVIAPKRGIHNYLMSELALEPLLRYTEKYRPPITFMVPPLMFALISHPARKMFDLSSIVDVSVGGAPLRQAFVERFEAFMPNTECRIIPGWGMTEITCIVANRNPIDRQTSHCIGELLPNVQASIMALGSTSEVARPYQPGEIWIKSPNVTQGYWRDPEKTASTFYSDGWLRTGDFGYYDDKQRLYVSDRVQDIIQSSSAPATFILPTDLETVLLDIPGVLDVGVTSVRAPISSNGSQDMVPRAFVVVDEDASLSSDAILRAFEAKVKSHEKLVGGLYIVKEVPKLSEGKVNRAALRTIAV